MMTLSRRHFLQGLFAGALSSVVTFPSLATGSTVYCPILMYHYISSAPENSPASLVDLTVPPDAFAQHLDQIVAEGFAAITMRTLWSGMIGEIALPEKPIVFTFDDGYWDAYANAAPLLLQRGMTGTVYIVTGFVDQAGYLTWGQVQELHNAGIEIGNHSVSHGDMSRQSQEQQLSEIDLSTQAIEGALGVRPTAFCYPFGRQNGITRRILADFNYSTAVTTADSTTHSTDNPYRMGRARVRNSTNLTNLSWLVGER